MNADDYQKSALRTMADQNKIRVRNYYGLDKSDAPMNIDRVKLVQLDNAARGMAGDVGEVNSCVQKCLEYGQQLDLVNLKEELGDVLWRIVQACDAVGFTLEEVMQANIAKLKARYPDKYSDFLATEENRDREGERQVVAGKSQLGDTSIGQGTGAESAIAVIAHGGVALQQNGQGFAEPKEEAESVDYCKRIANLIAKALEVGWNIDSSGILLPPEDHPAKYYAAEWKWYPYKEQSVMVPHWLEDQLNV